MFSDFYSFPTIQSLFSLVYYVAYIKFIIKDQHLSNKIGTLTSLMTDKVSICKNKSRTLKRSCQEFSTRHMRTAKVLRNQLLALNIEAWAHITKLQNKIHSLWNITFKRWLPLLSNVFSYSNLTSLAKKVI